MVPVADSLGLRNACSRLLWSLARIAGLWGIR